MNNVKAYRKLAGLSAGELCKRAGIGYMTLWHIEKNEKYRTSFETADKIAAVLGIPVEKVFPDYKRKSPYPTSEST